MAFLILLDISLRTSLYLVLPSLGASLEYRKKPWLASQELPRGDVTHGLLSLELSRYYLTSCPMR